MDSVFPPSQFLVPADNGAPRTRPLLDNPELAQRAVELIRTPSALKSLGPDDARVIAAHMRAVSFPPGTIVLKEGDRLHTGYLLLVLNGDVSVEAGDQAGGEAVPVSVIGPGSLVGEMSLLDGAPRSVTCIAVSRVDAGGLSREAVARMMDEHPKVAAKLMAALAQRMADRLRAADQQLRMYAGIVGDLQARLNGGRRA